MKILVAQIIGYGSYGKGLMLEQLQALIRKHPKAEIFYLTCSNSFNSCYFNPLSKPEICYLCKKGKENSLKLIDGQFNHILIEDLVSREDLSKSEEFIEKLENVNFDLMYEDFKVGESALSSYISISRDRETENLKNSFTIELIKNGISLYSGLKRYCLEESFDIIYNFNGRHIYNRAVMDVALSLGVKLYNVELPRVGGAIEYFKNVLPHNIIFNQGLFDDTWNNSNLSEADKEEIASEYFFKRRSGTKVNALSFTEDQKKNSLPKGVDYSKQTIVLYTSSDDEFAAIGDEFSNPYFKDQNEGIFYVAELFNKNFIDHNLIIRIHPNFAGVRYEYANKLNSLKNKFKNVHIVEPESKIDSYALMDKAEKIITFGSSITTEATFWGKPVIMLGKSFFTGMNVSYEPKDLEDIKVLISGKLESKPKLGSLKYGFYLIQGGKKAEYYDYDNSGQTYFKGVRLYFYGNKQILKSKIIKYFYKCFGIRIFIK